MKVKEESEKVGLKLNIQKTKSMASGPITSQQILQEMGIPDHLACLLRNLYMGQEQQLEVDIEQPGSKLGKEYVKTVYCHPVYLTSMQSKSCKMPGQIKHRLGSRLLGEISITSDMQMTPPLWQKVKKNSRAS